MCRKGCADSKENCVRAVMRPSLALPWLPHVMAVACVFDSVSHALPSRSWQCQSDEHAASADRSRNHLRISLWTPTPFSP